MDDLILKLQSDGWQVEILKSGKGLKVSKPTKVGVYDILVPKEKYQHALENYNKVFDFKQ